MGQNLVGIWIKTWGGHLDKNLEGISVKSSLISRCTALGGMQCNSSKESIAMQNRSPALQKESALECIEGATTPPIFIVHIWNRVNSDIKELTFKDAPPKLSVNHQYAGIF